MCISAVLGLGSALIGASAAGDAADAQTAAANQQLALDERIYDETTARFEPAYQSGLTANNVLNYELYGGARPMIGGGAPVGANGQQLTIEEVAGTPARNALNSRFFGKEGDASQNAQARLDAQNFLGIDTGGAGTPASFNVGGQSFDSREAAQAYIDSQSTGGQEYGGYEATAYNKYLLSEGQRAIDNSAASSGNLFSGATIKAQQDRAINVASAGYDNYLNRVTGQAAAGQAAAGNMANAGANYSNSAGQAYANIGNAQAAGAIGQANALQSGLANGVGLWNYQNQQNATAGGGTNANVFSAPWGSKGFWG